MGDLIRLMEGFLMLLERHPAARQEDIPRFMWERGLTCVTDGH